ncbi:MAG: hypothetical protein ABIP65_02315 [Vicinamibacterales bacterium]
MALTVLALIFATATLIGAVIAINHHRRGRGSRVVQPAGGAQAGSDAGWMPATFGSDGGGPDCSAADAGGAGCDGGGGGD